MTNEEILEAAKEAGAEVYADTICVNGKDAHDFAERFAAIIEKRTIERCAVVAAWQADGKSAAVEIRKLGDE